MKKLIKNICLLMLVFSVSLIAFYSIYTGIYTINPIFMTIFLMFILLMDILCLLVNVCYVIIKCETKNNNERWQAYSLSSSDMRVSVLFHKIKVTLNIICLLFLFLTNSITNIDSYIIIDATITAITIFLFTISTSLPLIIINYIKDIYNQRVDSQRPYVLKKMKQNE